MNNYAQRLQSALCLLILSVLSANVALANNASAPKVTFTKNNIVLSQGYDNLYIKVEVDSTSSIKGVNLYVDNVLLRRELYAPYEWGHNKKEELLGLSKGSHVLKAIATDVNGNKGVKQITVTVGDPINPPKGRLAVVSDGNSPDPDDIGAMAVTLGILKKAKLAYKLVHFSHSCDLNPFRNPGSQTIDEENELRRQRVLENVSDEGIQHWGPFNSLRDHFNCRADFEGAKQDLVDAINASSQSNPLWIIEAGEPDLIGYALEEAMPYARKYVHVVSHHPANDNSGDYFTWQEILDFGIVEHQIGDQNVGLQTAVDKWDWAKNHSKAGIAYIWDMLSYAEQDGVVKFQSNKFDCSDAGMIYWWITGADQGGNNHSTPEDMKNMLLLSQ